MNKIRCYLAGGFMSFKEYKDWRDLVKERLAGKMDFYDPRIDTDQGSIATFVYQDLTGVAGCDVIFYFVTSVGDIGAAIECARGDAEGKLVVLCVNEGVRIVHPFLIGMARRVFIGMEAGVAYLNNLADSSLANEFEAIYKIIKSS